MLLTSFIDTRSLITFIDPYLSACLSACLGDEHIHPNTPIKPDHHVV